MMICSRLVFNMRIVFTNREVLYAFTFYSQTSSTRSTDRTPPSSSVVVSQDSRLQPSAGQASDRTSHQAADSTKSQYVLHNTQLLLTLCSKISSFGGHVVKSQ